MLNDFLKIINSEKTKGFLDKSIHALYDKNFPFCTYIGINYTEEELLNVKLYVMGFKKADFNLIPSFFPYTEHIQEAYLQYEESKVYDKNNMGLAFAQKQDKNGNLTHGFCMRVKDEINPVIDKIEMLAEDKVVNDYFAFESSPGNSYSKYYYIILNPKNIGNLLEKFEMNLEPKKVALLEYAEFGKQKILAATHHVYDTENYLRKNSSEEFLKLHHFLTDKLDFIPASPGKYLNSNIKSIYYFDQGEPVYFRDSFALIKIKELLDSGVIS